eukprot:COSAG04_NODE_652_length_11552_cov_10.246136_3_plen_98_part_00
MDAATYRSLGIDLPHHEKVKPPAHPHTLVVASPWETLNAPCGAQEPPSGMVNLNTGQPNSWGRAPENPGDDIYDLPPLALSAPLHPARPRPNQPSTH